MIELESYTVYLSGIVQGVGMRPFIYHLAKACNLGGCVRNQGADVVIEIAGKKENIQQFIKRMQQEAPVGAKIFEMKMKAEGYIAFEGFSIQNSAIDRSRQGFIPTDTAFCSACLEEIWDSNNTRYRYPFTNCTVCGPRYSILKALPYDRANTSMLSFPMCASCESEYESPENRRFHAQTNCCPSCGPRLFLKDKNGVVLEEEHPLEVAGKLLEAGMILAIKGIGGYHLCCNALDEKAIGRLRLRKRRPEKPLALMAQSLAVIKRICNVTAKEEEILLGRQRPIVLLEKRLPEQLPVNIAPGMRRLGIMLPYTPLHALLMGEAPQVLVMTSGNLSGMPICYRDVEALETLQEIADFFLVHSRDILTPLDDSVVSVVEEKETLHRLARGYAPLVLPIEVEGDMIGVGAEQKASVCILSQGFARTSQYLGTLEDLRAFAVYGKTLERLQELYAVASPRVAHDVHPAYLSTQYALQQKGDKYPVQHHHAHMAACMAEHGITRDVIGIIYDGTGLGWDGSIWGGEFLVGSLQQVVRAGNWKTIRLQGGDSAMRQPWKTAVSYLYALGIDAGEFLHAVDEKKIKLLQYALRNDLYCFQTSSVGRLFDCVAALVTKKACITYEGQAAMELESMVDSEVRDVYDFQIHRTHDRVEIDPSDMIREVLWDLKEEKAASYIAAKFHNTLSRASLDCVDNISRQYELRDLVLGGGVFDNAFLLSSVRRLGKERGYRVYHNRVLPMNDGGIAFGQVAVNSARIKEEKDVSGCSGKNSVSR